MPRLEFVGAAPETSLATNLASTAGAGSTFDVANGAGYPTGGVGNFPIVINRGTATEEKILCSARATNTFTVAQRGYDGTTARDHTAGTTTTINHVFPAAAADETNAHVNVTTRDDHTQYLSKIRQSTVVVAANDTPADLKNAARFVCDGTNDDVDIEQAMAVGTGDVMLLPGTYLPGAAIDAVANTRLWGPRSAIIKRPTGYTGWILVVGDGTTYFLLEGLSFDGNKAQFGSAVNYPTVVVAGSYATIDGIRCYDTPWQAVQIRGVSATTVNNVVVRNCLIERAGVAGGTAAGIDVNPSTSLQVSDIMIYNNQVISPEKAGIVVNYCTRAMVRNNLIRDTLTSGDGISGYNRANSEFVIADNTIVNSTNHGIHVAGDSITVTGNNIITTTANGIDVDNNIVDAASVGATITGNSIVGAGLRGIEVNEYTDVTVAGNTIWDADTSGVMIQFSQRFTVSGNSIHRAGQGDLAEHGVRIYRSNTGIVSGNTITEAYAGGIVLQDGASATASEFVTNVAVTGNTVTGTTNGWGIQEMESSNYNSIQSNVVRGNASGQVSTVGANSLNVNNLTAV